MLSSHHQILIQTNNDSKLQSKLPIIHYMPEKNKPLFNYLNYPHGIQAQLNAIKSKQLAKSQTPCIRGIPSDNILHVVL